MEALKLIDFIKKYQKRIAVIFSLLLFTFASGYTSIYGLTKNLTIELNERLNAYDMAEVNVITNANTNKTIREVLEENSYPVDDNYSFDTDLDTKVREVNDRIIISKKINGILSSDGDSISYSSSAETVGDLLSELEIRLAANDTVEPSVDTLLAADNSNIVIHRQSLEKETREESISYETVQTEDPNLEKGVVEIDIPGIEGKKIVTEEVKYRDGIAIGRTVLEEEHLLDPVSQVQRVGTGANLAANSSTTNSIVSGSNRPSTSSSGSTSTTGYGYNGTNLSEDDYNLVCAIVEHEGGSSYEGALAVMSCVMNRVDANGYGSDPVSVLTAPGQFASYLDGYYKQFLNNSSTSVRQAVTDCLNGKRSHNYLNFRSYQTTGSEKIGGNWFF